ncbi:MAG TPA: nucleoside recognition protein [Peptococcaceae bacterium]|nr:nucleoside recognition protein [Peptococcaceae bacterium]
MVGAATLKRGLGKGLRVTWELTRVAVPVYIIVTWLQYAGVLPVIAGVCAPVMELVGLPGEASLALVMGWLLHLYAAIGVILGLSLSTKQITIIAGMLLLAHSLPLETVVARQTGVRVLPLVALRLAASFLFGILLNLGW